MSSARDFSSSFHPCCQYCDGCGGWYRHQQTTTTTTTASATATALRYCCCTAAGRLLLVLLFLTPPTPPRPLPIPTAIPTPAPSPTPPPTSAPPPLLITLVRLDHSMFSLMVQILATCRVANYAYARCCWARGSSGNDERINPKP